MKKIISEGSLLIILLALALAVLPGCSKEEQTETSKTVSGKEIKKETKEALEAASNYTQQQIQAFRRQMDAKLSDYADKIELLQAKVENLEGDARTKADQQLAAIRMKYGELSGKIDELKNEGTGAWPGLKSNISAGMYDLADAYEKAMKELGKP